MSGCLDLTSEINVKCLFDINGPQIKCSPCKAGTAEALTYFKDIFEILNKVYRQVKIKAVIKKMFMNVQIYFKRVRTS
jgi:hypothetical protein